MEFILLLVAVILPIVSFMKVNKLDAKIDSLANKILEIENKSYTISPKSPEQTNLSNIYQNIDINTVMSTKDLTAGEMPQNIQQDNNEVYDDKIIAWLKENWLLKLGVLLILVGFGWFISYAFVHNWIGPVGRISLGLFIGTVLALFGSFRMSKDIVQGNLFVVLGSGLIIITSIASQMIYGFFTPALNLGIIFIVSLFITTTALQFDNKKLAVYGLIISFLAPILTHGPNMNVFILFSYLTVIVLGSAWVSIQKDWDVINPVSLVFFCLYCLNGIYTLNIEGTDKTFVLFIVYFIALFYFVLSLIGFIRYKTKANESDILIAVIDSALIIFVTLVLVSQEFHSLIMVLWMLIFAVGSYFVFIKTNKESFFYVYSLVSVVMLAIATSAELEGPNLIIAFAFESVVISIAGYLITNRQSVGQNLSLLMIGPAGLSLGSFFSEKWALGYYHRDFAVLLVMAILLGVLGIFYYMSRKEGIVENDLERPKVYIFLNIASSFYFISLIWLVLRSTISNINEAVMIALVIYTIAGLITYFYGLSENKDVFKYYGTTLLVLVVLRLVLVDVWQMPLAERIITFVIIGLMFISTAFITKKVDKKPLTIN
jgi:uncharacterized membrane protein